ncbi:MAG TPA: sigma 54-interacting transcriptional regulator [Kofleriaceae bacterium]|nr:sigma 54-interacting transcriptional regulator [Kofleriaceae bacterium]
MAEETLEQSVQVTRGQRRPEPGVLVVFAGGRPTFAAHAGGGALGRDGEIAVADPRMSRRHVELRREAGMWQARDLGSRNGSSGDGTPLTDAPRAVRVVRAGDTIALLVDDVTPYLDRAVELHDGRVVGPVLRAAYDAIASAAREGAGVHVVGETGAGKELAARHFHAAGPRAKGPFVALNCAALPGQLAETLLFGARKGAYSGADADREGHLQAADGGTLFLDEVAELSLEVQAKLLRVLETREVVPLGATRARTVDVRIVSATHADLRDAVAAGSFREDLYFRLGRPAVALPPLRARAEEIPWLVAGALARCSPPAIAHVSLVEAALLRPWPGNVRELVTEVADAARAARHAGASRVEAAHLPADAGLPIARSAERTADVLDDAAVDATLAKHANNVSAAARELGVHRTQLRRFLERRKR